MCRTVICQFICEVFWLEFAPATIAFSKSLICEYHFGATIGAFYCDAFVGEPANETLRFIEFADFVRMLLRSETTRRAVTENRTACLTLFGSSAEFVGHWAVIWAEAQRV